MRLTLAKKYGRSALGRTEHACTTKHECGAWDPGWTKAGWIRLLGPPVYLHDIQVVKSLCSRISSNVARWLH